MEQPPDMDEILAIAKDVESEAADVNRRITRAYHLLSEAARLELDAGPNLDWCGFAKWSSHTVGLDLDPHLVGARIDELSSLILRFLPPALAFLRPVLVRLLQEAVEVEDGLVVKALRGGNAVIFAEMGSVFAHLLERLPERRVPNSQSDREFADEVVTEAMSRRILLDPLSLDMLATPPPESLARGIEFYLRAAREPAHRAELMLAGSMLFSVYEQARADRLITIGVCAPVRARLIPVVGVLTGDDIHPADVLLAGTDNPQPIIRQIESAVATGLTDLALVVEVAATRVRLGHPELLPPPAVTPTLPEVVQVMAEQEAGAAGRPRNWLDLAYRLGFIGRYFAAYQQKPEATAQPPILG